MHVLKVQLRRKCPPYQRILSTQPENRIREEAHPIWKAGLNGHSARLATWHSSSELDLALNEIHAGNNPHAVAKRTKIPRSTLMRALEDRSSVGKDASFTLR